MASIFDELFGGVEAMKKQPIASTRKAPQASCKAVKPFKTEAEKLAWWNSLSKDAQEIYQLSQKLRRVL